MSFITPRLSVGIPDEREEPYYQTARNRDLAWDGGIFANAENSQLMFASSAHLGWDAGTNTLFWAADVQVTSWTTPFKAVIPGPASVELQDGQVLFFLMPRLMKQNTEVQLYRANRVFLEGTRLYDLRWFAIRLGDTVYFQNGLSLKSGDVGLVFGGGLFNPSITLPHTHKDALKIEPISAGVVNLDVQATAPDLKRVHLYRNGFLQSVGDDYTINLATGIVTLTVATVSGSERFIALRECVDTINPTTTHDHLTPLVINPLPATALLDMLVTDPILQGVDLFRGGLLQSEPDDYTLDPITGFVTLVVPTVAGERFVALRRINI